MSYAHTEVAQIAAISSNRCIGKDNELPWHISADLQHFKAMTTKQNDGDADSIQGIVIMGRKTYESMGSKPLPKRVSFIISTQLDYAEQKNLTDRDDAYVVHNLDDALTQAASLAHGAHLDTIWVIGGEKVFKDAIMYTDRIELTHVDTEISDGDAFFPELPSDFIAAETSDTQHDEKSGLDFQFVSYRRQG
ncbi:MULTISPECIES: dihydrofolate reductase [unclassified Psychrobacter]|jgi:dihydrofolate reductase|uniref:dihydrofolate reductase n=1 Tax=unclassified Psychrobacter TaxID=196806 RepID=UPI000417B4FF|nr:MULTISPECIES: dihydrofolate reductase [unclassified Psychrobacter]MAE40402.1 dihydrofolate reductase [Psychrobacter sp.]HAM60480.1 dihydrofolate reductase [Psychrobacter sp.]|tara:strand:+ start:63 stop:638 length:576 start_codon:yes stop_codon:yes gene_type:complete